MVVVRKRPSSGASAGFVRSGERGLVAPSSGASAGAIDSGERGLVGSDSRRGSRADARASCSGGGHIRHCPIQLPAK